MLNSTALDTLNDRRDELISEIADLQSEITDIEATLDAARIELHDVDLQIKELERNATSTDL